MKATRIKKLIALPNLATTPGITMGRHSEVSTMLNIAIFSYSLSKPEQITFLKTCPYSLYKESRLDIDPMKIQSTPEQVNYRSMLRMTTVNSLLTSEDVAASFIYTNQEN